MHAVSINIAVMLLLMALLAIQHKRNVFSTWRTLTALALGVLWAIAMQILYGENHPALSATLKWYNLVSTGYLFLLQMLVIPLVFVSFATSIANLKDLKLSAAYRKPVIVVLALTTVASALITVFVSRLCKLDGSILSQAIIAAGMPTEHNPYGNILLASMMVFSILAGIALLRIKDTFPKEAEFMLGFLNSGRVLVMHIFSLILSFAPYALLPLAIHFWITARLVPLKAVSFVVELGRFMLAGYLSLAVIFALHLILLGLFGCNPFTYLRKSFAVLALAFKSRSSAATLPRSIDTMVKRCGIPPELAEASIPFASSSGQNGCAGMYPALLVVMAAASFGIDPVSPAFLIPLLLIIAVSSFGIASSGGGATKATLIVLSAMNLPLALMIFLCPIEPLIDMGRTLVNVSGGMLSTIITARRAKNIDMGAYNAKN